MTDSFIRARSASQKTARKTQILKAAELAIAEHGIDAATIADMSREANIAPSAFYKYFKSKEELLAYLLIDQAVELTEVMRTDFSKCADLEEVADRFASVCAQRPMFCELASSLARTLESNIAIDRLADIKKNFQSVLLDWVEALVGSGAQIDEKTATQFIRSAYVILAGLFPMTRERPAIQSASVAAGTNRMFGDFQNDFGQLLRLMVLGLRSINS